MEDDPVDDAIEEASDEDEEPEEESKKADDSNSGFVIINQGDDLKNSSATESDQFTILKNSDTSKDKKSESWHLIGDSHSSIAGGEDDGLTGSLSSFDNLKKVI